MGRKRKKADKVNLVHIKKQFCERGENMQILNHDQGRTDSLV